jgi:hypothetical protein
MFQKSDGGNSHQTALENYTDLLTFEDRLKATNSGRNQSKQHRKSVLMGGAAEVMELPGHVGGPGFDLHNGEEKQRQDIADAKRNKDANIRIVTKKFECEREVKFW